MSKLSNKTTRKMAGVIKENECATIEVWDEVCCTAFDVEVKTVEDFINDLRMMEKYTIL